MHVSIYVNIKHIIYFHKGRHVIQWTPKTWSTVYMLSKQSCLADVTCSLVSIGSAHAVCHLSHLGARGGDPRRVPRLRTLSALTQSNTDFCWGGRRRGQAPEHAREPSATTPRDLPPPEAWPSFTSGSPLQQLHWRRVSLRYVSSKEAWPEERT